MVLQPIPNYINSLPVKMFEYMAAGVPVVAADFPLWREIVSGAKCGLTVDPSDPSRIADAIERLVEDTETAQRMGRRGRQAVETTYHWRQQWIRLRSVYAGRQRPRV